MFYRITSNQDLPQQVQNELCGPWRGRTAFREGSSERHSRSFWRNLARQAWPGCFRRRRGWSTCSLLLRAITIRRTRQAELENRCFVARGLHTSATTVVGIATERYSPEGFSLDLCQLQLPNWTPEHQTTMEAIQADLGYFVNPRRSVSHEDEYPESTDA